MARPATNVRERGHVRLWRPCLPEARPQLQGGGAAGAGAAGKADGADEAADADDTEDADDAEDADDEEEGERDPRTDAAVAGRTAARAPETSARQVAQGHGHRPANDAAGAGWAQRGHTRRRSREARAETNSGAAGSTTGARPEATHTEHDAAGPHDGQSGAVGSGVGPGLGWTPARTSSNRATDARAQDRPQA